MEHIHVYHGWVRLHASLIEALQNSSTRFQNAQKLRELIFINFRTCHNIVEVTNIFAKANRVIEIMDWNYRLVCDRVWVDFGVDSRPEIDQKPIKKK